MIETLERRVVLAPIVAEFQAINSTTIQDEDGDFSDWIEIRNPDAQPVSLDGWYLTDDAADLRKWKFPAVTIASGDEILVFASGKGRAVAGSQLHANFRLSGNGEYLGLVGPDGLTVAQDFGAQYPAQLEDQSYGRAIDRDSRILIDETSAATAFVPTDDLLGLDWTQVQFDDSAWTSGTSGVGFENLLPGFTEREEFDAPLGADWTIDLPQDALGTVEVAGGSLKVVVPEDQETSFAERGLAPFIFHDVPGDNPADWEFITRITKTVDDRGAAGIGILNPATGTLPIVLEYDNRRTFQFVVGDEIINSERESRAETLFLRLVRDGIDRSWTGYFKQEETEEWRLLATVRDGFEVSAIADAKPALVARTPNGILNAEYNFVDFIVPDQRPIYGPNIGLDVGSQMAGNNSSLYMRMPFTVDGDPARFDELDIATVHDDGFKAYLNGVEMTAQNVPIQATWNSSASATHGAASGRIPVEQFDVGTSKSALRQGDNVLAIHGMNVAADDSDFFFSATLLASDLLDLTERFFVHPTPGAPNLPPAAPAPQVIGEDGVFFGSRTIQLNLGNPAPTLEIRYTLDGTEPTRNTALYTDPIVLTESAMLQARTFDTLPEPNFEPSNVSTGTFIAVSEELRDRTSDLPIMILDSLAQGLPASDSLSLVPMNVILFDVNNATARSSIGNGIVDYLGRGGARDRGASTANQPKPNMAFETWGAAGSTQDDDFNVSLLGLGADSDWVLHAPYNFDRALIRNQMAYELSNQMGMWASKTRNVEVYFNRGDGVVSEGDYGGVYAIIEKITQGPHRVDVSEITPQDNQEPEISGGYIWKVDRADPDAPTFSGGSQSINWVYPKSPRSVTARLDQKATQEQEDWVIAYFDAFAETLVEPDINDPEGYSKFIDVISWVDHHMHNVFIMNVDALRLSAYFQKDRDGKVVYGPVWDFDRSAESTDDRDDETFVWRSRAGDFGTDFFGNGTQRWWGDLFSDPGFWQLYVDRWQMWRQTVLGDDNVSAVIDTLASEVRESAERNFEKWASIAPRSGSGYENNVLDGTFQGEVDNMRLWLRERAAFMDSNFAGPPVYSLNNETIGPVKGVAVSAGQEVSIDSPLLEFFVDTTLIDGQPGATTATYFTPINDDLGDTWTTLAFDDSSWQSGPLGFGYDGRDNFTELIKTEVDPRPAADGATTIFARVPLEITDLTAVNERELVLRMKYDDGYVAYLNGVEVARKNLRGDEVTWDSRALTRSNDEATIFEDVNISEFKNLLVEGTNVLAVQAKNSSSSGNDMLLSPELVSRLVQFGLSPNAQIYYTTDGTDPRGTDGNPSASAVPLALGDSLTINENTRVIARNFDPSDRGPESNIVLTDWSGPVQYDFVVAPTPLVISEINYNPVPPTETEMAAMPNVTGEDFEFVEILNTGTTTTSLIGVELSDGVSFDFAESAMTSIDAGQRALVVRNQAAFELRYGGGHSIAGQYQGSLNNNGEDIDLIDGTGSVIFTVNYGDNDPWPVRADGAGATLELIRSDTPTAQQSKYYSWRGSSQFGGSPGTEGSGPVGVVINEILANTAMPVTLTDSIELHNPTDVPIDISGWYLSDSVDNLLKFQVPANTVLVAGGYVSFNESNFNPDSGSTAFALSGDQGDDVWLTVSDGAGGISMFVDDVHFRATANGESLARIPNGSGRLTPAGQNTFGGDNGQPCVGPIVITELNYNPGPDGDDLEFVELHNPTAEAVDLTNWRVRGGIEFDFGNGASLAANESMVLVKFNPDDPRNANRLDSFKTTYGIGDGVRILGGYGGQLNNSDDKVLLLRPGTPPANRPNFIPLLQEDEVLYDDLAPWPIQADGTGQSLVRTSVDAWGNSADSWTAGAPSPGSLITVLPGDSNGDGVFNQTDIVFVLQAGKYLTGQPATFREGDWNGDGLFNRLDLVLALQAGNYQDGPMAVRAPNAFGDDAEMSNTSKRAKQNAVDDVFAQFGLRQI